ncbi:hypothetical protein F5Y15DRAFT_381739 [Xylariaceae sp. FL0016]|nr:hypothetical protein F5Y15DRAFT_381739 [Xylariaceae sp. FL0016]
MVNFLSTTNLEVFTGNLVTTLTNQIWSSNPGDNRNSTLNYGRAFVSETYIRARWPCALFPVTIMLLTIALLVLSMIFT